jgi:hypothetical protein
MKRKMSQITVEGPEINKVNTIRVEFAILCKTDVQADSR